MSMFWKAMAPHLRNWNRSLFLWNSSSWFRSRASVLLERGRGSRYVERERLSSIPDSDSRQLPFPGRAPQFKEIAYLLNTST